MSVKAMAAVWDADLPRPEKFVLLALADHADHEGGHISPSLGRVALKTGYSYQKVLAIVKRMRETGIIESVGESEYRTRVYQICFEKLNPLPPYRGRNSLPHSKETLPSKKTDIVKKRDYPDGKETSLSERIVPKGDHPDSKEKLPSPGLMVKKVDHDGNETLPKPKSFKLVNIIKDSPEEKLITSYLSEALQKIGVTDNVSRRLLETHELQTISDWLELFNQANELQIARGAGWLVSALDQNWPIDDMRVRIAQEQTKQANPTTESNIPEEILKQLPEIGWVGNVEELESAYQNDPENFEQWLNYIRKETPNDPYQSGRFRQGLRSGLNAPEVRSEKYRAYLSNFEVGDEEETPNDNPIACRYNDDWQATINSMGIASHQVNCEIVEHQEDDEQIILKIRANDRQSYYNLQNLKTMKNFHNAAEMIFKLPVELEIEEYPNA